VRLRNDLPSYLYTLSRYELLYAKQSIEVGIGVSGVNQIDVSFYCLHARFLFRFFICRERRHGEVFGPCVRAQVTDSAPVINHHRDGKGVWFWAVAEEEFPIVTAKRLDFRPVPAILEAVRGVGIIVDAVFCCSFQ